MKSSASTSNNRNDLRRRPKDAAAVLSSLLSLTACVCLWPAKPVPFIRTHTNILHRISIVQRAERERETEITLCDAESLYWFMLSIRSSPDTWFGIIKYEESKGCHRLDYTLVYTHDACGPKWIILLGHINCYIQATIRIFGRPTTIDDDQFCLASAPNNMKI